MALSKIDLANMVENQMPQSLIADNINFRNIIINGDMSLSQRSTSVSSLTSSSTYQTIDRYATELGSNGTWTQSQSTDVPTGQGFAKSLKMDCTATGSGGYLHITQRFEGQNLQYLKKGTSNAESFTLSFWVKSAKTGTYIAEFRDIDNTRNISKSYTISSADTWEKKTITYPGDTSGAFGNDNGSSLELNLWLAAGSSNTSGTLQTNWGSQVAANRAVGQVNLGDSTSNEWYVTGVQLEAGTSASDFEFLPVDVNLDRCSRYFTISARGAGSDTTICNGVMYTASEFYGVLEVGRKMRAAPTMSAASGSNTYGVLGDASEDLVSSVTIANITNEGVIKCRVNASCSKVQGQAAWLRFASGADSNSVISADAEL
jgi:hypothetical protein